MRHKRHYSVDEANALRDWVAQQISQIRKATCRLQQPVASRSLSRAADGDGGCYPGRELAVDTVELYLRMRRLDSMDVIVRDLGRGLVDFPALRDGQEVYLCWTVGEPSVTHWHDLDAGAAGRHEL